MKYAKSMFCILLSMVLLMNGCGKTAEVRNELNIIDDNYRTYYEVFLYSYYDSDGDGIGDINGLINKLDYINDNNPDTDTDLGCTGIWLMPVMESTTYHKYDVVDYYSIDEEYGTMEDFENLISECHERGINLIIDFIFNHTSDEHEWFVNATDYIESLSEGETPNAEDNKYFGYYNFKQNMEYSDVYYQVGNTGWYYEAQFWSKMPDLNLENEDVKREIEEISEYYLTMGVDGFRLDAAKEYYSGATDKNIEVLSWFNDYVKSVKEDAYVVAEVWDSFSTFSQYYSSGIDSVFNYGYGDSQGIISKVANMTEKEGAAERLTNAMVKVQDTLSSYNPSYIDASFISNHDNNRSACYVKYDEDLIKLMAGINLMMSGSSYIYYGEEIGMSGSGIDENKRGPMYFSDDDSNIPAGPLDMEAQEQRFPSVEEQLKDSDSILNYYIRAIRLRNENPEILRGTVAVAEGEYDTNVAVITKTYEDSTIAVIYNLSGEEKQVNISHEVLDYEGIRGYVSNTPDLKPSLKDETLTVPAYGIVILK